MTNQTDHRITCGTLELSRYKRESKGRFQIQIDGFIR